MPEASPITDEQRVIMPIELQNWGVGAKSVRRRIQMFMSMLITHHSLLVTHWSA
ncbi:MAG TPA: hypothetical protein PLU88_02450 [Armatimonadota bacterium]|nr:hypothetical protein [Armatimonadota bacterium]